MLSLELESPSQVIRPELHELRGRAERLEPSIIRIDRCAVFGGVGLSGTTQASMPQYDSGLRQISCGRCSCDAGAHHER